MTNNKGDKIIKEQVGNMQVGFDKEAAWMRLQDRLESKDEKKPYFRIAWAAAAMLLIATTLWYSWSDDTKQPIVNAISETTQPVNMQKPVKEDVHPVIIHEKKTTITYQKKKASAIVQKKEVEQTVKEIAPEPVIVKEEVTLIKETPKVVVAPKPKMKTVHINEVIEEEQIERRMGQSRYAVEHDYPMQRKMVHKQEYNPQPDINKKSLFSNYNDDYKLIQN